MIQLYLNIRSGLGKYFKRFGSLHGKLYKKWYWELEHSYYSYNLLEIQLQVTSIFRVSIGILGYSIDFTIYNEDHDCW